jgi:hypothetical protein
VLEQTKDNQRSTGYPRNQIARLKREIAYYCGVMARSESRDVIRGAHTAIRQRERELQEALSGKRRHEQHAA